MYSWPVVPTLTNARVECVPEAEAAAGTHVTLAVSFGSVLQSSEFILLALEPEADLVRGIRGYNFEGVTVSAEYADRTWYPQIVVAADSTLQLVMQVGPYTNVTLYVYGLRLPFQGGTSLWNISVFGFEEVSAPMEARGMAHLIRGFNVTDRAKTTTTITSTRVEEAGDAPPTLEPAPEPPPQESANDSNDSEQRARSAGGGNSSSRGGWPTLLSQTGTKNVGKISGTRRVASSALTSLAFALVALWHPFLA